MKRLLSLLILGLALFYVAWPAYSGHVIKSALDAKDATGLNARIDFPQVRNSMRPAITAKVESTLDAAATKAGPSGAKIYAALKTQMMPKIVEAALDKFVTPEALIKVYSERGTIKDLLNKMVGDQVARTGGAGLGDLAGVLTGNAGQQGETAHQSGYDVGKVLGGLFGTKETVTAPAATKPAAVGGKTGGPGMTWRNIKGFGLDSPTGVYISLAKDAAASDADITAHMSFTDGGWVLTGLVPHL
jgi:Protein of unknown function (DUF2939)